jgi:hypothetical protein
MASMPNARLLVGRGMPIGAPSGWHLNASSVPEHLDAYRIFGHHRCCGSLHGQGRGSAIWLTASGVNTQNSANGTVNQVYLDDSNGGAPNIYDDLYILNSLGAENNAPLGEMRVYTTEPSGNGSSSSWTPSAGSNFGNVNQASPDDDTTYNFSDTPGQIDLYTSPAIAPTGPVVGVQVNLCERKDDVGARTTAAEYKAVSGASYPGANNFALGTGYSIDRQVYDIDPDTGVAWTLPGLNGAQFGINCIA